MTASTPIHEQADALIAAHLDGELDDAGVLRLEAWLASDARHRVRFLRASMDHRTLHDRLSGVGSDLRRIPSGGETANRPLGGAGAPMRSSRARVRPRRSVIERIAIVALVSAVIGVCWFRHPTRSPEQSQAAAATDSVVSPYPRLTRVVPGTIVSNSATGESVSTPVIGRSIRPGDEVAVTEDTDAVDASMDAAASAELTYPDGSCVRIARGAALEIEASDAAKRLSLRRGRIHAEVSPQSAGHPLTIATAEAEVTVLGTILAVTRADGETRAEVMRGRIAMSHPLAHPPIEVSGGEYADRATVSIAAGEYAIAAADAPFTVHAIGSSSGTTYVVGAGRTFTSLATLPKLRPGDVVELQPGTYHEARTWTESGTALRPIVIRGVGDAPAIIDGEGVDVSGIGDIPRALFQIQGSHLVIDHLAFFNARNHLNAAGIRCVGSSHTVIRRCRISRCDQGVVAQDDDLLIEDTEVGWCGTDEHDGYCHEIYTAGAKTVIRGCHVHDATAGQAIKSASRWLEVIGNRIAGAQDGEISIVSGVDAANADSPAVTSRPHEMVVMMGNLVASLPNRRGNHRRFIELGRDDGAPRDGALILIGNTFVAGDPRVVFVSTEMGAAELVAHNNIFVGSDQILGPGPGAVSGRNNWLPPTAAAPAGFSDGIRSTSAGPGFVDAAHGDYSLLPDSACASAAATANVRDGRDREYAADIAVEPTGPDEQPGTAPRADYAKRDVGAFSSRR